MSAFLTWLRGVLSPRWSWSLPSWLTEFLSGLACDLLALAILVPGQVVATGRIGAPHWAAVFMLATTFGVVYEWRIDPDGWSFADVRQRMVGIVAGCLLYGLLI